MTRSYRHLTFEERCEAKIPNKSDFQRVRLPDTRLSSQFGLHPHWDEGRVLYFRLEVGDGTMAIDEKE